MAAFIHVASYTIPAFIVLQNKTNSEMCCKMTSATGRNPSASNKWEMEKYSFKRVEKIINQ